MVVVMLLRRLKTITIALKFKYKRHNESGVSGIIARNAAPVLDFYFYFKAV